MKRLDELKSNDRQAIGEFSDRVKALLGAKLHSLRVYGSKIKGTDTKDSDIDMFIVVSSRDHTIKSLILTAAFDSSLKYGVYISPRVVPLELYLDRPFHATPFIQNVEKESLVL